MFKGDHSYVLSRVFWLLCSVQLCVYSALLPKETHAQSDWVLDQRFRIDPESVFQRKRPAIPQIVSRNVEYVCKASRQYNIPHQAIVYILLNETLEVQGENLKNLRDAIYDIGENALTILFRLYDYYVDDLEDVLEFFYEVHKGDKKLAEIPSPHKKRKFGENHIIFGSLGPGQIQVFLGMVLVEEKRIKDKEIDSQLRDKSGRPSPRRIARALVANEKAVIQFVSAEIEKMKEVWMKEYGYDVSQNLTMVWQLHLLGNFRFHAWERKNGIEKHPQPPEIPFDPYTVCTI